MAHEPLPNARCSTRSKQAMRLRLDDPKSQREALCQLRRYQNFEMPGFEQVAIIEGALMGLTEPESKALTERRRYEMSQQEDAAKKLHAEIWEESWEREGWSRRETMRRATERVTLLCQAASHVEKNIGGVELVKALARCLDAKMADQDPFGGLGLRLHQIDDPGEEAPHPRRNGNVIAGPWDAGEEARP